MAPNYEEALRLSSEEGRDLVPTLPRMMLQKPAEQVGGPMSRLTRVGRALSAGNPDVLKAIIDRAFERLAIFGTAAVQSSCLGDFAKLR